MIPPEARARLAGKMEERRLELRLTWREVAEAGGISYEVIRNLRNGRGTGIAPLTLSGIDAGLRWESGSAAAILAGGDPVPAGGEPAPVTATGSASLPPMAVSAGPVVAADAAEAMETALVIAAISPRLEREVRDEIRRHPEGTPASVIFRDPIEAALFERDAPESQRIRWIAALRSVDARPSRQARQAGLPGLAG